jgi:hypothetical protein
MREVGLGSETIEAIVAKPEYRRMDEKGNQIMVVRGSDDGPIEVVTALDDPDFVITVIQRRKWR